MKWDCGYVGDYPENVEFCASECPSEMRERCLSLQSKRYPMECWRVLARLEAQRQEVGEAEAFACGHRVKGRGMKK